MCIADAIHSYLALTSQEKNKAPEKFLILKDRSHQGFSLLEVLLTVVLLTVGSIALMRALSLGVFADTLIENNVIALNLAREKMEEIQNESVFSSIVDENRNSNEAGLGTFSQGYDREVNVTDIASDLKQIEVSVFWTVKGQEISLDLASYKADY